MPFDLGYRAVVTEGQETWLEIDLARLPGDFPMARLEGVVRVNGVRTADLMIRADHQGGGAAKAERSDAVGRFDLGEVPAGDLRVRVSKGRSDIASDLLVTPAVIDPGHPVRITRLEVTFNGKGPPLLLTFGPDDRRKARLHFAPTILRKLELKVVAVTTRDAPLAAVCAGIYFHSSLVGIGTFAGLLALSPWEPR